MTDDAPSQSPPLGQPSARAPATAADEARLKAVEAAINAGDLGRAIALAEQALDDGLVHPTLLNLRALKAEQMGRFDESLADLRRANAIAPEDFSILNAMGLCCLEIGRSDEAVTALEEATRVNPEFVQAWNNKGVALLAYGDLVAARASFEAACKLEPGFPEPKGHLALMAARRGDRAEARALAEAALAVKPNLAEAVRALAEVEMDEGDLAGAERRLTEHLRDAALGPNGRYYSLLLLGNVLDRQNRTAEAFQAYRTANEGQRQVHAQRFGRLSFVRRVAELHDEFRAVWPVTFTARPDRAPPRASPARRHVFLTGFMRSGTTLLEQVLASLPDAAGLEEKEALVSGTTEYLSDAEGMRRLRDADEAGLEPHRADYWTRVRAFGVDPDGKVFVDKMPFNGAKLPLIQRLFPEAKVIFAIRDPRDVVFSCFRQRFAVASQSYPLLDLATAVQLYDVYMSAVETFQARLPLALHLYRHEDLVADFDGQVRALCAFLDVPWNDSMRDVGRRSREGRVTSPSAPQLLGGLSREGLQQWRRYEAQLAPFYGGLDRWVRQFGYE